MAFESGVVSEDWRSDMIVPQYSINERGLNVRTRGICLLSGVRKIYAGILVDRVCRVTGGLIDDEQGVSKHGSIDQIFTLKQIGEKAR